MESAVKPIFARSTRELFETWELGAIRLDTWLPRQGREPYRPWVVLCRRAGMQGVVSSQPGEGDALAALAREALTQAAAKWKSRPARVAVADAELAGILEPLLAGTGAPVELNPDLPELRRLLKKLVYDMMPDDPTPGPLTGEGVTLRQLSAFAGAAAEFLAAPWVLLTGGDWIRVEAPEVEESLSGFSVEECSGRPRLLFDGAPDAAPGEFGAFEDAANGLDEDWDEEDDEEESEE
ncbi:MAG TPA: hypothetical protein VFC23_06850, partial [Thermoanaerobaculia bacterium]|nr:hypothetical protein [Thermoanaerobaculia bacterium]